MVKKLFVIVILSLVEIIFIKPVFSQSIKESVEFYERPSLSRWVKIDTESLISRININSNIVVRFNKEKIKHYNCDLGIRILAFKIVRGNKIGLRC